MPQNDFSLITALGRYAKFAVALVGALIAIATIEFGADSHVVTYAVILLTAVGVLGTPNTPKR